MGILPLCYTGTGTWNMVSGPVVYGEVVFMGKPGVRMLAGLFAAALVLCVSGCSDDMERIGQGPAETQEQAAENTVPEETKPRSPAPAIQEKEFRAGSMGDDYILPDAPEHVYTAAELSGLSPEELRIARNEIYARHGRIFKSDDLNRYFSGKSWYHATTPGDRFDMAVLNRDELDNLKVIQIAEQGRTVCSIPKIGVDEFPHIDGSTATLPLSQAIYRMSTGATAGEAEAAVTHGKTTEAWLSLIRGKRGQGGTDLVIAYEPGERVDEELKRSGVQIIRKPIGRDALVFLANSSNPVHSLTQSQIVDIYTGKVKNWKSVGGRDSQIQAFQRPEDSGSQNLMNKLVMKGKRMAQAPMDHVAGEMGELMDEVSAFDDTGDALGYSVYYYAKNMYGKPELSFMAVDGVTPSPVTIRDGSYPYVNDFYAAVRADEPKDSRAYQLFEWLTADDGQSLINGLGYVGITEASKALPRELTSHEEDHFTGTIALEKGDIILGSGSYLYGEQGTCVFDSGMHLKKFISHVVFQGNDTFTEYPEDAVIFAQDSKTGQYGHYSLLSDQWLDRNDEWDEDYEPEDGDTFAASHPEVLNQYGVTADQVDVRYYFENREPVVCIRKGNIEHYYNFRGDHLMDYDTQGKPEEELPGRYVIPVGRHTAYLMLASHGGGKGDSPTEYLVYEDSVLFKTLTDNQDGDVANISRHFYTRSRGNYLYIYNDQDEPCARFLCGYGIED